MIERKVLPIKTNYITHALRTLVKQGNVEAFSNTRVCERATYKGQRVELKADSVKIGEALEFEVDIMADDDAMLLVRLCCSFS